ncbi:Tensin-3 [Larimichthys crocea]|uniref:Uncharacterized protein n=1 Tax=Larimichthys crocea TaxID=215358 RepID=A0ACD3RPY6_LARCR|nr:Tensin-3 [Larimichthys crocea]
MEEAQRIDLTYITERIITILCPPECSDERYLQNLQEIIVMLQSKHGHNYMLINLSQKNDTLTRMRHKVLDTGWVNLLAPNLDQILSVCATMENWLQTHPKHVLVLHCRGEKGRLGVLVASYIHYSNITASADLSLDYFAMRRFYNDKLSALMTPSQKRYVWMLGSMLKGGLMMSPSPSFLLCVVLHGLPKIRPDGGCCLFLRVYQRLQAVCTSAVYHVNAVQTDQLYVVLQPAQLLKGDIMVVCYDKNSVSSSRQVVFRLQFHTGLVHGHTLTFFKADLDCASEDPRFPEDGKVELLFSDSPEKIRAPPHVFDPGNGSLCGGVRKKSNEEGLLFSLTTNSPGCSDRAPSTSSDSGLSVASQGRTGAGQRTGLPRDKSTLTGRLVSAVDFEIAQPLLEVMTELAACGGEGDMAGDESGLGLTINGEASSSERETDILDDEDEVDGEAASALDMPSSSSICSLSSDNLPETQSEYSTHSWVQQQQMAEVVTDSYPECDRVNRLRKEKPPPLVVPDTPTRGVSSRAAVQRGLVDEDKDVTHSNTQSVNNTHTSDQDEDLASLNTDIDESIEQLNQLILDLDPTFVPVPTRCAPLSRSASLHTNGLSHKGNTNQSGWKKQKQFTDVVDYAGYHSPGWKGGSAQSFSPSFSPSQHGHLYTTNSVDYRGHTDSSNIVPPTPAFPVSPPTPYVKHFSELSQLRTGGQWDQHSWTQDSRSFLDSMNHAGGSTEGDLFRSEVSVTPASCQRIFGSMCSVSSESPLPHTDSLHLLSPSALRMPTALPGVLSKAWGGLGVHRTATDGADLSSLLLGNGGLEHSLLEAMEGLGSLNLGGHGGLPPLLPEKRRGGEGMELGSHSPSLSGFSSPHSGSSLSIPFSSPMTPDPLRGLSGAQSPGADFGSKQDTVKFVQDTSKFWYKPDISRDQAIQVLKDKEPGSFIVRDSHSFRGAYGLAMKVATPPPSVLQQSKKVGDLSNELVRHFLIECTQKGVRLKGCPNEPYFGEEDLNGSDRLIFGFVARKSQTETDNMCHLFAEHDPEQPASAIVNFVSKVMIGSHKK